MAQKVVAHYVDHAIVKGTSMDVDPGKTVCHVRTGDSNVEVDLNDLKALYFVKDFAGKPKYDEEHAPSEGDIRLRGSHQVRVKFSDGEEIGGLMNRYPPNRPFFFLLPMDPKSNNVRILVNRASVSDIEEIADAGASSRPSSGSARPSSAPVPKKRTSWVFDGTDIKDVQIDR